MTHARQSLRQHNIFAHPISQQFRFSMKNFTRWRSWQTWQSVPRTRLQQRLQWRASQKKPKLSGLERVCETVHRTAHVTTHATSFSREAQGSSCSVFVVWLDHALFPLQHDIPTTPSVLHLPDRTNHCAPQPGFIFGRFVEHGPLTGSKPKRSCRGEQNRGHDHALTFENSKRWFDLQTLAGT